MMPPNAEDVLTPEQIAERIEKSSTTMDEFRAAQLGIIADRRKRPRDDVMTTFCQAEIDGERLDDESIVQARTASTSGGTRTRTSRSGSGSGRTSASAPRWRASRCG